MADIQEILGRKKAHRETVWIILDPALQEKLERLEVDLVKARRYDLKHNEPDLAPRVETEIGELEDQIAEAREPFTFEAIGRQAFSLLLDENKPRQGNDLDQSLGFHGEEFPPKLIATSAVDPKIDLATARTIWNEWSDGETTALISAAVRANKEVIDVPFTSSGTRMGMSSTERRSTTPQVEESPMTDG